MEKLIKSFLKSLKLNESTISTLLGVLVIIILGVLIFNYFKTTSQPETPQEVTQEELEKVEFIKSEEGKLIPASLPTTHQVATGEDLWHIAEKHYTSGYNWIDIAQANNLVNPDYLEVGQELKVPKVEVRKPTAEIGSVIVTLTQEKQTIQGNKYQVQKGDYLWDIAIRAYGDGYKWPEIAQANNLVNPDYLEVEQELVLPR